MPLRIVFMGTPDFSVPTLMEIVGAGHEVVAVYSQPPRAAGRGLEHRKSPVQACAEAAGLPVLTPASLKGAPEHQAFRQHRADVAVVVAYGLLLPKPILEIPASGCLNLHASALPRWRGAAPIQRAIMAGDAETAVMVMRMEEGLDTGPICLAEHVPIGPNATAGELHDELSRLGASLMVRALAALERGSLEATPQPMEGVTYAPKISKGETRIDFNRDASTVHNQIRGLSPFPGAWFEAGPEGRKERIKVLRSEIAQDSGAPGEVLDDALLVACREGAVRLTLLQRAGKKPMMAADFLRGFPVAPGARFG
jgi:methionyl-tRNA formyltransferase